MLVESIAHYGLHSCVAPVVASKVDIVEITAHGYRQLVVDRHGVHQCYVLLKSGTVMGTFAKLCKHRGSELHVESTMKRPTIPSAEAHRIACYGFGLTITIDARQMERVLMNIVRDRG